MNNSVNLLNSPLQNSLERLAEKVRTARTEARLSLDDLARRAAVSKGTLFNLEAGEGNPSLGVLCSVGSALGLSLQELFEPCPTVPKAVEFDQAKGKIAWKGTRGGSARLLVGTGGPEMIELWQWELEPGEKRSSRAHAPGTYEVIVVSEGCLGLQVDTWEGRIEAGRGVLIAGDHPHRYWCQGATTTKFLLFAAEWPSAHLR